MIMHDMQKRGGLMTTRIYGGLRRLALLLVPVFASQASAEPLESHFACKDLGRDAYRPYYMQAIDDGTSYKDWSQTHKGLLGQNAMASLEECEQALAAANDEFGVICSRTGLDGWKPT